MRNTLAVLLPLLLSNLLACQTRSAEPHLRFRAGALRHSASIFDLYFVADDRPAAQDVARELAAHLDRLRKDFRCEYAHRVAVEIYSDQAAYDANLMDPSVKGSPACSGRRTIQMVSPRSPIRDSGISYAGRLSMAVHELAHLFVNEINRDAPVWLSEGVASFEGDADGYRRICKMPAVAELLKTPPSIAELEASYHKVRAPDVFSFTLVDYVASNLGMAALNDLLRNPADFERALGGSRREIEARWHEFVKRRY